VGFSVPKASVSVDFVAFCALLWMASRPGLFCFVVVMHVLMLVVVLS
jgi:hypothetical protein